MRVKYHQKLVNELIAAGCSEAKIAKAIKKSRAHVNNITGKNKAQEAPEDLKTAQLSGLISLCKQYGLKTYDSWSKVGKVIDSELENDI